MKVFNVKNMREMHRYLAKIHGQTIGREMLIKGDWADLTAIYNADPMNMSVRKSRKQAAK